jgi:hypothetical protein
MINQRYKRASGPHAAQIYTVIGPSSEIESPARWVLHNAANKTDKLIVTEDELKDPKRWLPVT